jgi:hypothetical protein
MTVSKNRACLVWGRINIPSEIWALSSGRISTTYGRQRESDVCYDSERAVKLLMESHEPQGVKRLYMRQGPAIEAARETLKSGQLRAKRDIKTNVSMGALLSGNSSSYGDA